MIEFALTFPGTNDARAYLKVQVLPNDEAFLDATTKHGYEVRSDPELRGISFNMENDISGHRAAWVVLNLSRLSIETIHHEVRHAVFWYLASPEGLFTVDVNNLEGEESVNRAIDLSVRRAVHTITEACETVVPYFEFEDMPELEQMEVMGRVR